MNEEAKKKILRNIPYGLYVIGVKDGAGGYHAFTGSWITQCSMKPPRIALGVRHETHSFECIQKTKVFSVNFLAKEDKKIFEQFFKATPSDGNRFGELKFTLKATDTPILEKAVSYLECRVVDIVDSGDHSIVIGDIVGAEVTSDQHPLIMSDTPWHYGG